jgi:hypothetical protein
MGKKNCMVCTDYRLLEGGEMRVSGTDGTRGTVWFLMVS